MWATLIIPPVANTLLSYTQFGRLSEVAHLNKLHPLISFLCAPFKPAPCQLYYCCTLSAGSSSGVLFRRRYLLLQTSSIASSCRKPWSVELAVFSRHKTSLWTDVMHGVSQSCSTSLSPSMCALSFQRSQSFVSFI